MTRMKRSGLLVSCFLIAFPTPLRASDSKATPQVKDFDALYFEGEKANLLRKGQEPDLRSSHISRLVELNAREAIPVLASLLEDPKEEVRRTAAQFLATLGDKRGLEVQLKCATDPGCERDQSIALRLLGSSDRQEFAGPIALQVQDAYGNYQKDSVRANTRHGVYLRDAVVALARLGRREDCDLILKVFGGTREDLTLNADLLEALGYLNDPRANQMLWNAYEAMLKPQKSFYDSFPGAVKPSKCVGEGLGVKALLPLSRLGDRLAIEKLTQIIRGIGTPEDPWGTGHTEPTLCLARGLVFHSLKPRDARNFAETVFEVAAQDPEGAGTRQAWDALGVMHPKGFGDRLLRLAMRTKPHWKFVTRQALHDAVMASDPSLNEAFWREYEVQVIPAHSGQKILVEMGLSRLMYSGADYWMWWTGD
jgi:hypothetical protein